MQLPAVKKNKKRLGRGLGSGAGSKSGRGMKGQRSRAGFSGRRGFEGGQTPLYQRLPKGRGVKQTFSPQGQGMAEVTIDNLNKFGANGVVGLGQLNKAGLIEKYDRVKLIGAGEITHKLTVRVHGVTQQARQAIEGAGGKVEIIA